MNRLKNYVFVFLLALGGLIFFAYKDARERYQERMQEAFEENVEMWSDTISGNHMTSVSENTLISTETLSGNEEATNEKEVVYTTVDESYFDDAVFIGDSRTVGLYDYAGLENTDFFASSGLTIYKLFEEPDGKFKDGNWKENIETSLQKKQYKKIYLMIGINEMGTGDVDYFMEHYEAAVARIRQLQPDAIIYLQGIMHVTTERSAEGDYIHNEGIMERNERIAQLADNETVFYLDVNSVVCDESGGLNPQYTFDGVHLYAQYVHIWTEYLMEHAVKE